MDNQRLLVWATFGMLLWFTYQAWVQDYAQSPAGQEQTTNQAQVPAADDTSLPELPDTTADAGVDAPQIGAAAPTLDGQIGAATQSDDELIRVVTDVLELEISVRGGTLQRALISKYPDNILL